MTRRVIIPPNAPPPLAPYSSAIRAGDTIYVSGTLALDQDGKVVGVGDVAVQTRHVLETIKSVLEAAGATLKDVTFNQVFIADLADYQKVNVVYREYFPSEPPARYCIRADLVKPEFLVEIATTAYSKQ